MTLLAKKQGMSTSDFRGHWAGPHAKLALGMDGIAKYVHNRVDMTLWFSGDQPMFNVDGIVELYFSSDEAMARAQASAVGRRHIPADEPNFLLGWTLCVVDTEGGDPLRHGAKVIVPFLLDGFESRVRCVDELSRAAASAKAQIAFNWTATSARRERLWAEPTPPDGFAVLWFQSVAAAHEAFDQDGAVRLALTKAAGVAYLMDELKIR
ncbi:EthD domain-containing protein [Variovorax ureilyticus]|uniref:EthD domain-containing protein n=1 Tax=Variovorax ureilyticus TaxID=1836198 RepID=A0ABU8VIE5_9BURK